MKYKVQFFQNDTYEVLEYKANVNSWTDVNYEWDSVFQGRLADCEAYIRLHEGDYM